jgi:hypothetical protein
MTKASGAGATQIRCGSTTHSFTWHFGEMAMPSFEAANSRTSLAEKTSEKDYFSRVGEQVRRIAIAADEAQAVEVLMSAANCMGAECAAFVSFIRDDPSHESFRFLLACDPVWCLEYEQQAWYADDPWLTYALSHTEPARASEISTGSGQQKAAVRLAEQHGFCSAAIVPAPSSSGLSRVGVLCLGHSQRGYFEGEGFATLKILARSLSMELHEWWVNRIKRQLVAEARISEDDLMLLRHERAGLISKEIAAQLGTSKSSVDSRFQRISDRLGVPNRRAAAALAAEYGLI